MMMLQKILQSETSELFGVIVVGLLLGLAEKKSPARNTQGYRDFRLDVFAICILFFEAGCFVLLIENLRVLEIFHPVQHTINSLPWYVLIPATSIAADFINYFAHRLLHSHYFWRFHRWHHSPEQLFWFSGFRGSFLHIFLLGFKNILLITLSDMNPWVIGTIAAQGLLAQMLGHLNFDLHLPILSKVLVMPQYHRIHHAVDRKLHDSNYSFVWVFWDKIFGTQTPPETITESFALGLPESEKVSLLRMLIG